MLKTRLTEEEFNALPEALKQYYKKVNGAYVLETDEAEELRTAAARARQERDEATQALAALNAEREAAEAARIAAEEEAARRANDIPAIEASWQTKLDAERNKGNERVTRLETMLRNLLVVNKAQEIANKISTAPALILPHIRERLSAELDGDEAKTRVLDASGKPTAMTLEELEQEFVAREDFSSIIKGTNANGGGANGGHSSGGAAGQDFNKMTESERVSLARSNNAEFRRLAAAAGHVIP